MLMIAAKNGSINYNSQDNKTLCTISALLFNAFLFFLVLPLSGLPWSSAAEDGAGKSQLCLDQYVPARCFSCFFCALSRSFTPLISGGMLTRHFHEGNATSKHLLLQMQG